MAKIKEIPPRTISGTGMRLYGGYMIHDLRIRTYVPTTIFDPQSAEIRVYKVVNHQDQFPKHREEQLAVKYVRLHSMPKWNMGAQCLELSAKDTRAVESKCSKLERKFTEI